MKYLVMECSPAYAVLMDEESRVVRAANLHYTVGQTVTDPILMDAQTVRSGITRKTVIRIAAAAACLLLLSAAGFGFYLRNRRPQESVVVFVEQTRYKMAMNRNGEVIQIEGEAADGKTTVVHYDGQHLTLSSALNTVLQESIEQGSISEAEPVQIYLAAENEKACDSVKSEIEQEAAKLRLNADVQVLPPNEQPPARAEEPPKQPDDPMQKDDPKEPPQPPAEQQDPPQPPTEQQNPPQPPQQQDPPLPPDDPKAETPPDPGKVTDGPGILPPENDEKPEPHTELQEPSGDDKPAPPEPPAEPENPPGPPAPKSTVLPPVGAEPGLIGEAPALNGSEPVLNGESRSLTGSEAEAALLPEQAMIETLPPDALPNLPEPPLPADGPVL
jgi:hypothetical protein